jgi:eukaryotic translation initiation factor 2-alpha kinase 4
LDKNKLEEIEKDLDRLKKIRHPNIVIIYESELKRCLQTGWNLHILMEYARGGTLVDLLKKCGVVRLSLAREYMKQLLMALEHIHSSNFVHKGKI